MLWLTVWPFTTILHLSCAVKVHYQTTIRVEDNKTKYFHYFIFHFIWKRAIVRQYSTKCLCSSLRREVCKHSKNHENSWITSHVRIPRQVFSLSISPSIPHLRNHLHLCVRKVGMWDGDFNIERIKYLWKKYVPTTSSTTTAKYIKRKAEVRWDDNYNEVRMKNLQQIILTKLLRHWNWINKHTSRIVRWNDDYDNEILYEKYLPSSTTTEMKT